jgi:hypothetical protein
MKIASYKAIRSGFNGVFSHLIRRRLRSKNSHTELVFEPSDGVDHLMPDGTCEPDENGALWCFSSSARDVIPAWSRYRAGRVGGCRFKRIVLAAEKWDLDTPTRTNPVSAALKAQEIEGSPYDWQLIAGFLVWFIPQAEAARHCTECVAECIGHPEPWRFDPAVLPAAHRLS